MTPTEALNIIEQTRLQVNGPGAQHDILREAVATIKAVVEELGAHKNVYAPKAPVPTFPEGYKNHQIECSRCHKTVDAGCCVWPVGEGAVCSECRN